MIASNTSILTAAWLGVSNHAWGVAAFVGVYVLLLIWLGLMPRQLLDEPVDRSWWQSSRLWAIAITLFQILIYLSLG